MESSRTGSLGYAVLLLIFGCGGASPPPVSERPVCVDPAADAAAALETDEVLSEPLPDIDGDGQADIAYFTSDGGNAQITPR